jgi:hypothetical protein
LRRWRYTAVYRYEDKQYWLSAAYNLPNSLYIRKERGQYFVSFCYDNGKPETASHADNLAMLAGAARAWLEEPTEIWCWFISSDFVGIPQPFRGG